MTPVIHLLALACFLACVSCQKGSITDEDEAKKFFAEIDGADKKAYTRLAEAHFTYDKQMNDVNAQKLDSEGDTYLHLVRETRIKALDFNDIFMKLDTQRKLTRMKHIGVSALPNKTKLTQLMRNVDIMRTNYSNAKICTVVKTTTTTDCTDGETEVSEFMATSNDAKELSRVWVDWRNATGKKILDRYKRYVRENNEAIQHLGFTDLGHYWRSKYETPLLKYVVYELFQSVRDLYTQLHAYVRTKLKAAYPTVTFPSRGHIPAHLLGDIWAQNWENLYDIVKPYKDKGPAAFSSELLATLTEPKVMFEKAQGFFESLGFEKLPTKFWSDSVFTKSNGGSEQLCSPSVRDFGDGANFRITSCAKVSPANFATAHRQIAHAIYMDQYKEQPRIYREGPNPAFHEALGEFSVLSVQTSEYVKKPGLVALDVADNKTQINFLMKIALEKLAFLPYAYSLEWWRWMVFDGSIRNSEFNKKWWEFRCRHQGISPPVTREKTDFDPGAKEHVAADQTYIEYFLGNILSFQFYKAACHLINHKGDLSTCDLKDTKIVGEKLKAMLKLGSSVSWQAALKSFTGYSHITTLPLLEYFQPLLDFLRKENGKNVGWTYKC